MNTIRQLRKQTGVTQQGLAQRSGTSQSTIAAYETGKKSPSIRTLQRLAHAMNLELDIHFVPLLTREERRSLAYHHAVAEKLIAQPIATRQRARKNLTRLMKLHPHANHLFIQWKNWLELPDDDLLTNLLDTNELARDMRQVSPFAGLLPPKERAQILARFRAELMYET
ncbi:MAG: helix-turn-helix transcriptional regulator [Pseudomonadota bacterium]